MQDQVQFLIKKLLAERSPEYARQAVPESEKEQRRLLRALMNTRAPGPLDEEFLRIQDEVLTNETQLRGIVDVDSLPVSTLDKRLLLWQGDITRLNADAIVNAANSQLLGCFVPNHACIDNAIHSAAGLQLRNECEDLMSLQNGPEATGTAKITKAYNLPSKYVIHTVGPIIRADLQFEDCEELASCYDACLDLAEQNALKSIAFCCISTGEFRFPNPEAAVIAVKTVMKRIDSLQSVTKIIFNVFKDLDYEIYNRLLNAK